MNKHSIASHLYQVIAGVVLFALILGIALAWVVHAASGIRYAKPGGLTSGVCDSWENACELQYALGLAASGEELWAEQGIYKPTTGNDRAATFQLKTGVAIYGGFDGTETAREQRDWAANVTVLSGDIDGNDITDPTGVVTTTAGITGTNSYHVVTGSGTDGSAVLNGFFITAGQANGADPNGYGGGLYNVDGSPTLTNVTFSGNTANSYGGGMYNTNSSPTLTNVSFSGNQAMWGGGMFNDPGSPTLTNVTFSGNTAGIGGGGMGANYSSPTLTNVTFSGNTAPSYGGGMYNGWYNNPTLTDVTFNGNTTGQLGGGMFNQWSSPTLTDVTFNGNQAGERGGGMFNWWGSNPTLTNVTFSGNTATNYGGGMYNQSYSSPTLTNVTFSGNTAPYGGGMHSNYYCNPTLANVTFSSNSADYGGGIYNTDSSNPTLVNTILWGNTALSGGNQVYNISGSTLVISYSDIQGSGGSGAGWDSALGTDGGGNIDADPLFVSAPANLRLQVTSPAIDAGNNAAVPSGVTTDPDGNPRYVDIPAVPDTGNGTPPIVDMGAYEAQCVVAISKAVSPLTAAPGQPITFTLTISNDGSLTATHVVVTDTLPAFLSGTSFTATLNVTDTGHSPPYVWTVQDLAPGQRGVITVTGMLTVPLVAGTYTNTATIAADNDFWDGNNTVSVTFTVLDVAPLFTSTPVTSAIQDVPYAYTATAEDANGDALTLTAPTLPAWLTLTDHGDGTATLSGTPSNADVGDHAVVLRVTDSSGLYATQSFTITVVEKPWYRIYLPLALRNTP